MFVVSSLCCYSQSSVMGVPRQSAAQRASFNDIISIGELIKSMKELGKMITLRYFLQ